MKGQRELTHSPGSVAALPRWSLRALCVQPTEKGHKGDRINHSTRTDFYSCKAAVGPNPDVEGGTESGRSSSYSSPLGQTGTESPRAPE